MAPRKKVDPWAVHTWKIEKLIDYARNPRKNDHAVDEIASAIKEFGFRVPILAKSDGSMIDGHLRLKAARKLGMAEVPVMLGDDLSEAQIKAFRISVNKMAEKAEWDLELLRLEVDELLDMDFDIGLTGMSDDDLDMINFDDGTTELPELKDGDRDPFQQMTFTLHDQQAEEVTRAMTAAKNMGPMDTTLNENGNGNALARICEMFNGNFGGPE